MPTGILTIANYSKTHFDRAIEKAYANYQNVEVIGWQVTQPKNDKPVYHCTLKYTYLKY